MRRVQVLRASKMWIKEVNRMREKRPGRNKRLRREKRDWNELNKLNIDAQKAPGPKWSWRRLNSLCEGVRKNE